MVTRSIVGRFLILAVLLVSLGVIAQAALIISKNSGKADRASPVASAAPAADVATVVPKIAINAQTPPGATPAGPAQASMGAQPAAAGAAPIRVVYPGPLGDAPVQPRKVIEAASATPASPPLAATPPASQQAPPAAVVAAVQPVGAAGSPPAAKPAAVVLASAEADTQPIADAAGKGGVNLNNASVDALNHLGGGHIGQTIVQHRPYHSVDDLMKKRVVRRSVYEQIKGQVAAE